MLAVGHRLRSRLQQGDIPLYAAHGPALSFYTEGRRGANLLALAQMENRKGDLLIPLDVVMPLLGNQGAVLSGILSHYTYAADPSKLHAFTPQQRTGHSHYQGAERYESGTLSKRFDDAVANALDGRKLRQPQNPVQLRVIFTDFCLDPRYGHADCARLTIDVIKEDGRLASLVDVMRKHAAGFATGPDMDGPNRVVLHVSPHQQGYLTGAINALGHNMIVEPARRARNGQYIRDHSQPKVA